jgi:hypothetical protein
LAVQCFSPDALDITSAHLSADRLVVILTVAAPDKFVQDTCQDIAYQIATSIYPDYQLEEPVSINYVASMTGAYSKADEHLSVEDSNIGIAVKQIFCILPLGVWGSNAYFNKGRINENNHLQLQAFPFIVPSNMIPLTSSGLGWVCTLSTLKATPPTEMQLMKPPPPPPPPPPLSQICG